MIALLIVCGILAVASAQSNPPFTQGPFGFYGAGNNMWGSTHCLDGSGSGSIFVTGFTDGQALGQSPQIGGGEDWFIAKFNKNGGFLTVNSSNPSLRFLMTPAADNGLACISDTSGSVYVVGSTTGFLNNVTRTNAQWDSVVSKFDAQMNRVWTTQFNAGNDDGATRVILSGNTLYVLGTANTAGYPSVYLHALDPTTGSPLWARPVLYGSQSSLWANAHDITVNLLTNDIIVTGKYYGNILPGLVNASGIIPPALPSADSYNNGFIASFSPSGVFNWHRAINGPRYDIVMAVTTDVTGAIFMSGCVTGRVNDADYLPVTAMNPLPFLSKYSPNGAHVWTNILPANDNWALSHIAVDGLGGVYAIRSHVNCLSYTQVSYVPFGRQRDCSSSQQSTMLIKANSANGAVQYSQPISNGIVNSMSLDREGLLTLSGQFLGASNNLLHGVTAPSNVYYTFIDQQQLSYNCSCSELTSVVNEMVQLLRLE